jgi:catechol 2,3-dioxygenase-like lactoylglutathione lyase family enzyme
MGGKLQANGIDHVVLHVRDLERAKRFYVDFLGMTIHHERPTQAFVRCGSQQIGLFQGDPGPGGVEVHHMALRLDAGEYEQVKALLESEGFTVHGRPGDEHCIYFNDPDGHSMQLLMPGED